jgi:hypothetical protein
MWEYDEKKVARLVATMLMTKWSEVPKVWLILKIIYFLCIKNLLIKLMYIYINGHLRYLITGYMYILKEDKINRR